MLSFQYRVPGPNFTTGEDDWREGTPEPKIFAGLNSCLLFDLLGQTPADVQTWVLLPADQWMEHETYRVAFEFVSNLEITNDVAER